MHTSTKNKTQNKTSQAPILVDFATLNSTARIKTFSSSARTTDDYRKKIDFSYFFTPLSEAVATLEKRRKDPVLMRKVLAYLDYDIPKHFNGHKPIIYLSRHLATPNFEALKFIETAQPFKLPIVISEDRGGKFASINETKKALGKMSIVKGMNHNKDEIIENFTIVDFQKYDGAELGKIKTTFGTPLQSFHHHLFKEIYPRGVRIVDETAWVNRHHRDDILEQYKHMLALLVVHGVMCETYYPQDLHFTETILKPAFDFIQKEFGCRPLIHELVDGSINTEKDMSMYPSVLYPFLTEATK